jgi:DNA-binding Lrp family transcriptional regulator
MQNEPRLDALDRKLLDAYQHGFPLTPRPFETIAATLGTDEATVIDRLGKLQADGCISRIGAVVAPHRTGWSTLAAMAVPEDQLEAVAAMVSAYPEVNHNYERDHRLNLWFVVTGADRETVETVLDEIEARAGIAVLDLPMLEAYRLDLGFPLQWT